MHHFAPDNPVSRISALVGNTPLLEIHYRYREKDRRIFAKYEPLNLTGSIKDRMALHILGNAYAKGLIQPNWEIVEATSGNTGISFVAIGRALGHPVRIFMPDWMSEERKRLLREFGASLEFVSREQGGFIGSIQRAEEYATTHAETFLPRQFSNRYNSLAHEVGTGPEILRQLASVGLIPDAFVAGVGTGGTVMGVGRCLKTRRPEIRVHPLEPANSPVLTTGCNVGKHRIQGISDEFVPDLVELESLDGIVSIDDGDAIILAQQLACRIGLGLGISSGANVLGAIRIQAELGDDAVVVTVLPDSNKKYLSTDLMHEEPIKDGFSSPEIELLRYRSIQSIPLL
ncbi:MAG: PLP-dependent cysteine synthase family protein [Planctomycetota bacterium]|jgi:cysteine synthase A